MVAHFCKPNIWEAEAEDQEFRILLSYTMSGYMRLYLDKTKQKKEMLTEELVW